MMRLPYNSVVTVLFCIAVLISPLPVLAGQSTTSTAGVYPLDHCLVSGEKLGSMGDPVILNHEGREIRFCCEGCVNGFKKDSARYLSQLDHEIIKSQAPYYPLKTCLVSGQELGSMGAPVDFIYMNRLIRFCCDGCRSGFMKTPEKYIAKLDNAVIETQKQSYTLKTCVVSDHSLGTMGEPIDYVFGSHLVRFCCDGCISTFLKNPSKYLSKITGASAK